MLVKTSFHTELPDPISGASSVGSHLSRLCCGSTMDRGMWWEQRTSASSCQGLPWKVSGRGGWGWKILPDLWPPNLSIYENLYKTNTLVILSCCLPIMRYNYACIRFSAYLTYLIDGIQWKVQLCPNRNAWTEVESLPRIAMNGSFILTAT